MNEIGHVSKEGFVHEGAMVAYKIGNPSKQIFNIDDENAVAALVQGPGTRIVGLTHGKKSHLFFYDSWTIDNFAWLITPVAENAIGGELVCSSKGIIYGVSVSCSEDGCITNTMFKCDVSNFFLGLEMWVVSPEYEEISCPFKSRRISKLVIDKETDIIYGIFMDDRMLFSYDTASGELTELGDLGLEKDRYGREYSRLSKVIEIDGNGRIYCVGTFGEIIRYYPESKEQEHTGVRIPAGKGKDYVNEASALVYDPIDDVLYGGTLNDCYLFCLDVEDMHMTCIGKPIDQRHIRCLGILPDGRVYGIAGEPKTGMVHLFKYNPETADLRDLGVPASALCENWIAHEIDTMVVDTSGHIIMGENDRMSHIISYFPPIRER
jgi:hypothetical protein